MTAQVARQRGDHLLSQVADLAREEAVASAFAGNWRADYSEQRPHSKLGWRTPSEFAFYPRRDLALRYAEGFTPAPVAPAAQQGNPTARNELTAG